MKLATLDSYGWHLEGTTGPISHMASRAPTSCRDIADYLAGAGADVMYVHASALKPLGLPEKIRPKLPDEPPRSHPFFDVPGSSRRSPAPSVAIDGKEIMFGAYQGGAGDPFADARDGAELLAALCAFRDAFDPPFAFLNSSAVTGWHQMHRPWLYGKRRKRGEAIRESNAEPVAIDGVPAGAQCEVPYGSWSRPELAPETRKARSFNPNHPYVKAYDVNGQRLAACSRLPLGVGKPVHFERGEGFHTEGRFKLPGYHRVTEIADAYPGLIPPIFGPGWHTTPRLRMAESLGLDFTVSESWVWPEGVAYLDPFYEAMRDARTRLRAYCATYQGAHGPNIGARRHAGQLALGALKQAYLQPLGRLRSAKMADTGDPLYRPSWYDHIIGQELAREYLRLHQLAEAGVPVLAVYFDTIIIESDTPDLDDAPEALTISDQLGKYKPIGVLPTEEAHALLYGENEPNVGALVKGLKDAGSRTRLELLRGFLTGTTVVETWDVVEGEARTRKPSHGGYPGIVASTTAATTL